MRINNISINKAIKNAETLVLEDLSLSTRIRHIVDLLILIVKLLVKRVGLNSSNSSKPPSLDPKRRRGSKRKSKGRKRKPGGQKGHKGYTLKKVNNPDHIEIIEVNRRTLPPGNYTHVGFDTRQVIEIKVSRVVTEYRAEILQDDSGTQFVAEFPPDVRRPIQYGASIKANAVYLSQYQLLPYDRIRDYFADHKDIPLSSGSVFNFNKEAYRLLDKFENIAINQVQKQNVLGADETGINVNGKNLWLHSLSNDSWTLFFPHQRRGKEAMLDIGVLPNFHGILCHDHWKPYFHFSCLHALCNAHHLRELECAIEQDHQKWAKQMKKLLLEMNKAKKAAGGALKEKAAEKFRLRYRDILKKGDQECPGPGHNNKRGRTARSKSRNLLERLRDFEEETLRFLTKKEVPFTNNQSENDLRMTKVQQKISGCFRSFEGAKIFCRIRSYITTCRKHGVAPTDALELLFSGKLPDFINKLE